MPPGYPPLDVAVVTPRLQLRGATDELLTALLPTVRRGVVADDESPFDDPMSLYADGPEREWRWLRSIWAGRARATPESWRVYLVVLVDGEAVGMQDLIGVEFASIGTVATFSWLSPDHRGSGLGREMRAAVLELAFAGFGAREASSDAFADNDASNRISGSLGYEANGTDWATRRGAPAQLCRWKLSRELWESRRRNDIGLSGVAECRRAFGLTSTGAAGRGG